MTIAVFEYTPENVHLMRSDYAARKARLYVPQPREPAPIREPAKAKDAAKKPVKRRLGVFVKPEPKPRVRDAIHDWLDLASPESLKPAPASRIINMVSAATGVSRVDILSARRTAVVVQPRMIACWLLRHHTTLSLPEIGRRMGGRDHTTILSAVRKINRQLAEGREDIRSVIDGLALRIQAEAA